MKKGRVTREISHSAFFWKEKEDMKKIERKIIDWKKTGRNLQLLREDDIGLRRFVCNALRYEKGECSGKCDECRYEMDNHISRAELAKAFSVSENMVVNWENGKSRPTLEDLLFYADICGRSLFDLLVTEE